MTDCPFCAPDELCALHVNGASREGGRGKGGAVSDESYNGWANYETWAVGMFLDGNYTGAGTYEYVIELVESALSFQHLEGDGVERRRVADYLKDFVERDTDPTEYGGTELNPLVSDLLGAALSAVDWYDLAEHWIDAVREQAETV